MINWTEDCTKVVVASQSLTASGRQRTLNAEKKDTHTHTHNPPREWVFYGLKRPVGGRLWLQKKGPESECSKTWSDRSAEDLDCRRNDQRVNVPRLDSATSRRRTSNEDETGRKVNVLRPEVTQNVWSCSEDSDRNVRSHSQTCFSPLIKRRSSLHPLTPLARKIASSYRNTLQPTDAFSRFQSRVKVICSKLKEFQVFQMLITSCLPTRNDNKIENWRNTLWSLEICDLR